MKIAKLTALLLCLILFHETAVLAQSDGFGVQDTLYIDIEKVSEKSWLFHVSLTNDEDVEALSVPLKMTAGLNRIVADSAVYIGGRVEKFALKAFRADTLIQCVTLGMVANLAPTNVTLAKGRGRLVTIFVSSLEDKPIEKLIVDTTTTHPNNSLIVVAGYSNWGDYKFDTITVEHRKQLEILPVVVIRQAEK